MRRAGKRAKKLEVPMGESDWLAIEALRKLLGERSYANTARRAIASERARREREEAEQRELQAQLAGATP